MKNKSTKNWLASLGLGAMPLGPVFPPFHNQDFPAFPLWPFSSGLSNTTGWAQISCLRDK